MLQLTRQPRLRESPVPLDGAGRDTEDFRGLFFGQPAEEAAVLGHELVHALLTLNSPDHAALLERLDQATMELASYRRVRTGQALDPETQARLAKIRAMSEEIEQRAETVEIEVWRELRASRR